MKYSLPEIVIFVLAASLPAYGLRFHVGPLPSTVLEAILLAAIAILGIFLCRHPRESGGPIRYVKNFLTRLDSRLRGNDALLFIGGTLILLATIIGIVIAPDRWAALGIAKAYFWEPMILAWLFLAAKPDAKKIWQALIGGLAVSAGVIIVYGLIQYAFPNLIPATYAADRRITSFYSFPNAIALFLAPITPLFLSAAWSIPLAVFSIIAIVLAQSAGGMIAVAAALFCLGVWSKKTRIVTLLIAALVALVVLFAPPAAPLRDQVLMRDWSGRVHQIGWKESWNMLKDHPLFGAGLSGYQTTVTPYHTAQGVEIFQYPHNLFLAAWSEIGLIGLIGLILTIIWFFKVIFTNYKLQPTTYNLKFLAASMIAILVHGLVDVPYFKNDLAMMFWILIAIAGIMNEEYARKRSS